MTINSTDEIEDITDYNDNSPPIAILLWELFMSLQYLTFLVIVVKKHADHLEPVHILTINTLVDMTILVFVYFIHQLLVILTGTGLSHVVMFENLFGLLFVILDAYHHEWITNTVSSVIVIIIKLLM